MEQRTFLETPNLVHGTARKSDIDRDPGLGRAISLFSPYSSNNPSKSCQSAGPYLITVRNRAA